nr:FecR domain-containing protein [Alcaligenes faecalis]
MTEPIASRFAEDPRDAAAYWFARHSSGRMSDAEYQQFEQWRHAHPDHEREYQRAQAIQIGLSRLSPERLHELCQEPDSPPAHPGRRRFAWGLALTCGVTIVAGTAWFTQASSVLIDSVHLTTAIGKQHRHTMSDQTVVHLNTATDLSIEYYEDRRVARLLHGEASFAVTPSERQPFYVMAGDATVRVTGTRFNVIHENEQTFVAVESGHVEVSQGPWWRRNKVALQAGQTVHSLSASGLSKVQTADITQVLAWEQERIVFNGISLNQALQELNRYRSVPLRTSGSTGQLRLAGVFNPYSQTGFLELLPKMLPVRIESEREGVIQILPR